MRSRRLGLRPFEVDRHHLGDTLQFHRDAEERVGELHAALVVGDHDDLRLLPDVLQQVVEPEDVGFVERGVDLVQQAERSRPDQEDGENEGDGGHGLLAAGQQAHARELLAGRVDHVFDPGFQRLVGLGQHEFGRPAVEQAREDLGQLGVDGLERLHEAFLRNGVDLADHLVQVLDRLLEVGLLGFQKIVALAQLLVLLDGPEIHVADARDLGAEAAEFGFERREVGGLGPLRRGCTLRLELGERGLVAVLELSHHVFALELALGLFELEQAELLERLLAPRADGRDAFVVLLQIGIDGRVVGLVALDVAVQLGDVTVHAGERLLERFRRRPARGGLFGLLRDFPAELLQPAHAVGLEVPEPLQAVDAVLELGVERGHLQLDVEDPLVELLLARRQLRDPGGGSRHLTLGGLDVGRDRRERPVGAADFVVQIACLPEQLFLLELHDLQLAAQGLQILGGLVQRLFGVDLRLARLVLLLDQLLQVHVQRAHFGLDRLQLGAGLLELLL